VEIDVYNGSLAGLVVAQRRGELEAEAKPLGARLYAEKPGAFVDRLQVYWHVWRAEVRVEPIAVS
jgi:hypothetical protein